MTFGLSGLPAFEYHKPVSLHEALTLLDVDSAAKVYLGGTDLFTRMRRRTCNIETLIDLKAIRDFPQTCIVPSNELHINPQTTFAHLLPWLLQIPGAHVLVSAIKQLGTSSLRNRATLAGNLCNASPAADSVAALIALNSRVVLQSLKGKREVKVADFVLAPGKTDCKSNELVTELILPIQPSESCGIYMKLSRNRAADLSICAVAVQVSVDKTNRSGYEFQIVVNGANPKPIKIESAGSHLADHKPGEAVFEQAAQMASLAVHPVSDIRGSKAYRKAMVYALTLQALTDCYTQLKGKSAL
jgi:carbon-monoxide dehydrogenase medium subunit